MVHNPTRTDGAPSGQARTSPTGGDRIAKALARAGVASRRDVERLIEAGRVALNGQVLTTPAVKVEPGDILTVDGKVIGDAEPARLFRYHKPVGLVTTHKDPHERPTVFENLPEGLPRLISIGRLDVNSEGLLLLTNDGGLARELELPATGLLRRYRARARGRVTQEKLDRLRDGVTVEGVHYGPIEASLDKAKEGPQGANLWITVALSEGKNREVRRVLESLGLTVNRLIRLAYGPFSLGTLMPGEIEEVGPRVIREQLNDYIAAENMPTGDRPQFKTATGTTSGPRRGPVQIERGDLSGEDRPARYSPPNRRRGGGEPAPGTSRGRSGSAAEAAPKKEYKPGWAKAKAPKPGGAPSTGKPRPPKPGPRSAGVISAGPKSAAPRSAAPRSAAPRTAGPRSADPRSDAPRADGPRGAAARSGPARPAVARSGPSRSGPSRSGPGRDAAAKTYPPRTYPAPSTKTKPRRPNADGPMTNAERPDHRVGAPKTDAVRPREPSKLRAEMDRGAKSYGAKGPRSDAPRSGPARPGFAGPGPARSGPAKSGPPRAARGARGAQDPDPRGPKPTGAALRIRDDKGGPRTDRPRPEGPKRSGPATGALRGGGKPAGRGPGGPGGPGVPRGSGPRSGGKPRG
jgi:23S rRNA pseudouridine2605 synthase